MATRAEMVIRIGEDLTELVDEIIDKCKELEEQGIDPGSWDGWTPYKKRLDGLNEDSEARLIGIFRYRKDIPRIDQKTLDGYLGPHPEPEEAHPRLPMPHRRKIRTTTREHG